jgi:hypothetical protein
VGHHYLAGVYGFSSDGSDHRRYSVCLHVGRRGIVVLSTELIWFREVL